MLRWVMLFVVVGFCLSSSSPLHAKRFALVIGNDDYENIEKLQKAENDAAGIAKALQKLDFNVSLYKNLSRKKFNINFQKFLMQLNKGDDVLFFFAGHGVALRNNEYLLPIDVPSAGPGQEILLKGESIPVHTILDALENRGVRLSMLILDACRNNPFKREGTRSLGTSRGLGTINAPPTGTVIVYSAARGETALDRLSDYDANPNSVFTRTLIPLLQQPGLELSRMEKLLKRKVKALASSVSHQQVPAVYNELVNDFYFIPPPAGSTQIVAPQSFVNQQQVNPHMLGVCGEWPNISRTASYAQVEYFLTKCTTGVMATMARAKLKALKDKLGTKVALIPPVVKDPLPERLVQKEPSAKAKRLFNKAWNLNYGQNGERQDYYKAVELYRKAAALGHPSAKVNLGYAYEQGHGVARDLHEAARLYQEAADLGETQGMTNLGFMYEKGRGGLERSLKKAVFWYRKAAEANNANGMTNYGYMLENGRGVTKNYKEAVRWYQKATDLNQARGQNNLAYMYLNGRGVNKDNKKAMSLYKKAAGQNFPNSLYMIGYMHELGRGVPRNGKKAAAWVLKALKARHAFSVKEMTTNATGWSATFRKELQRLMAAEGYYHGAIDGAFGPGTYQAVRAVAGQ